MKKVIMVSMVLLFFVGCGEAYYDNVISIGPIDEISEKTTDSMGNVFNNLTTI